MRSPKQDERWTVAKTVPVIGLLGGVASGKSLVARMLADLGACVLDADRTGHEVLQMPEIKAAAQQRWGERIFDENGRIDRKRLAEIVFAPPPGGPPEREYLEQITHPKIGRLLMRQAEQKAAAGCKAVVLDAALLLEAGWNQFCDHLVFVDAPRPVRLARAIERGWSEKDFTVREGAQESLDFKQTHADVVVDNSGSPEQTRAQIEHLWHSLVG